ncbi:hypothetical protein F4802DRAFT_52349 [Xylaria palmicola]|nr:hypothetical protein F4802DRAFT_52349 [Xylaria palmicola]
MNEIQSREREKERKENLRKGHQAMNNCEVHGFNPGKLGVSKTVGADAGGWAAAKRARRPSDPFQRRPAVVASPCRPMLALQLSKIWRENFSVIIISDLIVASPPLIIRTISCTRAYFVRGTQGTLLKPTNSINFFFQLMSAAYAPSFFSISFFGRSRDYSTVINALTPGDP